MTIKLFIWPVMLLAGILSLMTNVKLGNVTEIWLLKKLIFYVDKPLQIKTYRTHTEKKPHNPLQESPLLGKKRKKKSLKLDSDLQSREMFYFLPSEPKYLGCEFEFDFDATPFEYIVCCLCRIH